MEDTTDEIQIAITFDTTYAMPGSVTLRSAITHTTGRISFYIVDCGLTTSDRERLQEVASGNENVRLQFVRLPEGGLTTMGPVWAKIDMLDVLAHRLDRLLYLDADLLVRDDLRKLWDTDLSGHPLAAVLDVGIPMGHSGVERGPFLNAGVLLLDLVKIRERLGDLTSIARARKYSLQKDEDALNEHFRREWLSLSLRWNAQGLGTYADWPSDDRTVLDLTQMVDPGIVHFMGPVNPTMEAVMDHRRQPYPAKPWGYAGAPGHPYVEEWWAVVDQTPWKGWRTSKEYAVYCAKKEEDAIQAGMEAFRRRVQTARCPHGNGVCYDS